MGGIRRLSLKKRAQKRRQRSYRHNKWRDHDLLHKVKHLLKEDYFLVQISVKLMNK